MVLLVQAAQPQIQVYAQPINWSMVGVLITVGALALGVSLLALEERFRRKFATKEDIQTSDGKSLFALKTSVCNPDGTTKFPRREELSGFGKRIEEVTLELDRKLERNTTLYIKVEDRVGDLEGKVLLLEERQSQQHERISEQMARTADTMRQITVEMKEMSHTLQEYALRLERMNKGEKS